MSVSPFRRFHQARFPVSLLIPAVVGLVFITIPGLALVARAPWSDLAGVADNAALATALRLSLLSAAAATALSLVVGVPLGWLLARGEFRGRSLVRGVALTPLALPPVVGGLALLLAFGRRGLLGEPLEALGVVLPFTLGAAVLAQTFVALPFVVLAAEGAIRAVDPGLEETAATLGASPLRVFLRVTVPMARPGLMAGAALAWARALGEFGATLIFAGSVRDRTQTLPLAVFEALQTDLDAAVVLALVLVIASVAVIVALRGAFMSPGPAGGRR